MNSGGLGVAPGQEANPLRPSYKDVFCPMKARESMKEIVEPILLEEKYQNRVTVRQHTLEIAESVRNSLREGISSRYKVMVQVLIGQKQGQGIRLGTKCFWDSNTDSMATYTFTNDYIFCVVIAYVNYFY